MKLNTNKRTVRNCYVQENMNNNKLDNEKLKKLETYIDSIEEKEGCLINILHEAQDIFGYLPQDLQLFISRKLEIPAAKVFGVVTFYSYFTMEPRGKHVINICMGTACFVKGADKILAEFKEQLKVKDNMSEDGIFTIDTLRCVGACGLAPAVTVDGKVFGRVKVEDVGKIIKEYREE